MSDDEGKRPSSRDGKKKPFRVVKSEGGTAIPLDPTTVKQIYMASGHIEWTPFAKSLHWDPEAKRQQYPDVKAWIQEKRDRIARQQAETIAEAVFDHRSRWHTDVLKTLNEYPEVNDVLLGIVKHRINRLVSMINADASEESAARREGREAKVSFDMVPTREISTLAATVKLITETKHKSLLIGDWSVKTAEAFTDPAQFERAEAKAKNLEWKVTLIGGENMSSADMQKLLTSYYDKPQQLHDTVDLVPEPPQGGEE